MFKTWKKIWKCTNRFTFVIYEILFESVYVCVCQSERGELQSVESLLSMLLLKWQRLLKWSNVASAGERETLPHTDRKHKHTLILLTHSRPWCTHSLKYVFIHLQTQGDVKWKERTQPQTCTHNYMHACVHSHPRIQKEMPAYTAAYKRRQRRFIFTHTQGVWKYTSGWQAD